MVEGSQLRQARKYLGLTPSEVAGHIGVPPEHVLEWEGGRSEPNVDELTQLAEVYHRGLDYFLRVTPAPPESIHLRLAKPSVLGDIPAKDREVLARFDELCRAEWELEQALGISAPVDVPRPSAAGDPHRLADFERQRLGVGPKPISKPRPLLEQLGVRVFELEVPENSFAGLSWWHDEYGPCVLVNAGDPWGRRNFTLAHEYGHLLMGDAPGLCDLEDRAEERQANAFAAEFLMPAQPLLGDIATRGLPDEPNLKDLAPLAGRWGVSVQALVIRLEQLSVVARGTAHRVTEDADATRPYYPRGRQPRWRRRLGDRFVSMVIEAHRGGHISLGVLAHYLDLPVRKARDLVAQDTRE